MHVADPSPQTQKGMGAKCNRNKEEPETTLVAAQRRYFSDHLCARTNRLGPLHRPPHAHVTHNHSDGSPSLQTLRRHRTPPRTSYTPCTAPACPHMPRYATGGARGPHSGARGGPGGRPTRPALPRRQKKLTVSGAVTRNGFVEAAGGRVQRVLRAEPRRMSRFARACDTFRPRCAFHSDFSISLLITGRY